MGTTVVAALLQEALLTIVHDRDSRLCLVRDRTIQALTTDHSWIAEQILKGNMTEEGGERSPRRNIVTRALGAESNVRAELTEVTVKNGDMLLWCPSERHSSCPQGIGRFPHHVRSPHRHGE
ncbi:MAG: hypothetical protein ABI604_11830 [Nitrospirota bacterium]